MFRFVTALILASTVVAHADREPKDILADVTRLQGDYKTCLTEQTIKLGSDNSETADTILRAVSAVCRSVEYQLRSVYGEMGILSRIRIEALMIRDRKLGEDAGIAALLQARASQKK